MLEMMTKTLTPGSITIVSLLLWIKGDIQKIERMIKDILIKRRIDDYVVIQDAKEKDKIVILKREHGEQLGIYHCRHCGMAFEDEIQLTASSTNTFFHIKSPNHLHHGMVIRTLKHQNTCSLLEDESKVCGQIKTK